MENNTFNLLYKENYAKLIRFAQSYVHDIAVSEDLVVDSLMYYWENRDKLSNENNIPAYVMTTLKHKCLNHLKHINIRKNVHGDIYDLQHWELNMRIRSLEECNPTDLMDKEIKDLINKTLLEFPAQTRDVFVLSRYGNQSHKEIAEKLKITPKAVEFHITKVLKRMRVALHHYLIFILGMFVSELLLL